MARYIMKIIIIHRLAHAVKLTRMSVTWNLPSTKAIDHLEQMCT